MLAWLLTAGVALATANTIASDLSRLHRQARASGPLVSIVVARHDLLLGRVVTARDLRRRRVFAADRPDGVLRDPAAAVGKVVTFPVLEGAPVVARALADRGDGVRAGTRVVRVVAGDGLVPPPGSVVDVLATLAGGAEPTIAIARGAIVLDGGGESAALLLVPEDAAARIAYALADGTVTLVLAPAESACCSGGT